MTQLTGEHATDRPEAAAIDWNAALVEHGHWLRTVVLARAGEPQAIDEVLQEVGLAVASRTPKPSDARKIAPWLYRVAVAQSIRYRRAQARQRRRLTQYGQRSNGDGGRADPVVDPLQLLLAKERRELVGQALQRLPGRDAEILLLKYAERWSYRQLSEYLGIRECAVDGRLQRARLRLRRHLAALGLCEEL